MSKIKQLHAVVLLGVLTFCPKSTVAEATTIVKNDFSNLSAFTLNGAVATINSSPIHYNGSNVLRMTNNYFQTSSAFLTKPVSLGDGSFSSYFQFQMTNPQNSDGADGIVFVLQSLRPNILGGVGGQLGYGGISPSIGIEFDTWDNGAQDNYNGSHAGIDINGNINSVLRAKTSQDLGNGSVYHAWVDYDNNSKQLEIRMSLHNQKPVTTQNFIYTVDVPAILGSKKAYIGFTGATGAATNDQDIRAWTFNSTPEPASILLLGSGLVGMLGLCKKGKKE